MSDQAMEPPVDDTPSRGDQLLEKLKANRKRPAQFSVVSVLILTFLIAALFAVARATGDIGVFFARLYFALYLGFPLVAYTIAGLLPGLSSPTRQSIEFALATLMAAATVTWISFVAGPLTGLAVLLGTIALWGAQVLLLNVLHRLLFSK